MYSGVLGDISCAEDCVVADVWRSLLSRERRHCDTQYRQGIKARSFFTHLSTAIIA